MTRNDSSCSDGISNATVGIASVVSAQVVNQWLLLYFSHCALDGERSCPSQLIEIVAEEKKEGMAGMKEFKKRLSNFPKVRIYSLSLFVFVVHWLWIICYDCALGAEGSLFEALKFLDFFWSGLSLRDEGIYQLS